MPKSSAKEQIKILWILLSSRWGGPEQVAMSDVVELAHEKIPVSLMCIEGSPVHAAALRHPHLKVYPVTHVSRGRFDFPFTRALKKLIEEDGAKIVHINDEFLLWHLVPALRGKKDVSIIASRHIPMSRSLWASGWGWAKAVLLRRLDYMIVLNERIRDSVLGRGIVSEKKVKIIHLGLDFSRFDPDKVSNEKLRREWGADSETIVIGSVGRLVPEVGQDTFLKAAAGLLKHQQDYKLRFVIVGEDPLVASEEYIESLKELVRVFHMEDIVTFASLQDNLPQVMAAFDIFVMPGREEVPGLGALEALAMERSVVLSNTVGAEEIVGRKQFGLLVSPDNAFDLQAKVLNLLENPDVRVAMGKRGRAHVLKYFDKQTRFRRSYDIYERCIKRRLARERISL
jgi:glycosyltransferase involved in cell wall biosynthesis